MIRRMVTINNADGLEERSIAMLVQKASQFNSSVYIEMDTKKINAKSIMGMMSLSLCNGQQLVVVADGTDEEAAVTEIEMYLSTR